MIFHIWLCFIFYPIPFVHIHKIAILEHNENKTQGSRGREAEGQRWVEGWGEQRKEVIEQARDLENFSSQDGTYVNIPTTESLGQGLNGPKFQAPIQPYLSIVGGRNPRGIIIEVCNRDDENIITSELQTHPQSTGQLAQNIYKQTRHPAHASISSAHHNILTCIFFRIILGAHHGTPF